MRSLLVLCLAACGGSVAPTAEAPTTELGPTLAENVDFRFAFEEVPGWRELEDEARQYIHAEMSTVLVHESGIYCGVLVEAAPAQSLEATLDSIIEGAPMEQVRELRRERTRLVGEKAYYVELAGVSRGIATQSHFFIFLHQGHAYRLLFFGVGVERHRDVIEEMRQAFRILPGTVGRPEREEIPMVADSDGPGWRIRDRRYVDAVDGLVAEPGERWRFLVGPELRRNTPEARLGMRHSMSDVFLAVVTEVHSPEADYAVLVGNLLASRGAQLVGAGPSISALGTTLPTKRYELSGVEVLVGYTCAERCVRLHLWYSSQIREEALDVLEQGLPRITRVSESERARLEAEMLRAPFWPHEIGPDFAFRDGELAIFPLGLRARLDPALWKIQLGLEVQGLPGARLSALHLRRGIEALLTVQELPDDVDFEQHVRAMAEAALVRPVERSRTVGVLPGLVFEGAVDLNDGISRRATLAAIRHRGHIVWWIVSGPTAQVESADGAAVVRGVLGSMTVSDRIPTVVMRSGMLLDRRLGFQVRPPDGWMVRQATPANLQPLGAIHLLAHPSGGVMSILAVQASPEQRDSDAFLRLLASRVTPPGQDPSAAEIRRARLGSYEGEERVWDDRTRMLIVSTGRRVFMLVSLNVDPGVLEAVRSSFEVL